MLTRYAINVNNYYGFQVCIISGQNRIITMTSDINDVVSFFYNKFKGENWFRYLARIKQYYVGISNYIIQPLININHEHCLHTHIFSNKENLKLVIATKPMERYQIDLVFFEKKSFRRWEWQCV